MSIIAKKDINRADFNMYWAGCFVRDPSTGDAAIVDQMQDNAVGDASVTLSIISKGPKGGLNVRKQTYTGESIHYFLDMRAYYSADLGYRTIDGGNGLVRLRTKAPRAPNRGLSEKRIFVEDEQALVNVFGGKRGTELQNDPIKLSWLAFNPEFYDLQAGLSLLIDGKQKAAALNNQEALTLSAEGDCDVYPIKHLREGFIVGKYSLDRTYLKVHNSIVREQARGY